MSRVRVEGEGGEETSPYLSWNEHVNPIIVEVIRAIKNQSLCLSKEEKNETHVQKKRKKRILDCGVCHLQKKSSTSPWQESSEMDDYQLHEGLQISSYSLYA